MSTNKITDPFGRDWLIEDVLVCVGPGWRPIVIKLIEDLFNVGWDGHLHQIKEKFGGLRFYIGGGSDEIFNLIDQAEAKSYETCEQCGALGKPTNGGWILTLCDSCAKRSGKKHANSQELNNY